ncbi:LamG domain-containing protein [Flavisolibacter sp. BT320]|nr:LamG domain-containing protein [Flavisolibacter longurius]
MKNNTKQTAPACRHARKLLPFVFTVFVLLATTTQAQVTNNALQLDGLSNYATLGTISPTGNFSTGLTFEAWVKWGAFNNWSRILELSNGSGSNNLIFSNEGTTRKLRFEVYRGSTTSGLSIPQTLTTGRWYHVAVTQTSEGLVTLYVDGIAATSATLHMPVNVSRTRSEIGRSAWNTDGYFKGSIDEVRIWNVARTATEIRQNMLKTVPANATGLIAYYSFDEASGATLTNTCTNGGAGNGTLVSGTKVASPIRETANALALDGTNDYVGIGTPLPPNSSYTKEAWVYLTKDPALPQNIISSTSSPFWIAGSLMAGNNGAANPIKDPTPFPTNTWVHVAVSYNAANGILSLYRDGNLVNSGLSAQAYQGQPVYLGTWYSGTAFESYFGGQIDEVRIWNVARTGAEIAASMNKELNAAAEPTLVSRYSFNLGIPNGDNAGLTTIACQKSATNATLMNMALTGTTSNLVQQKTGLVILPVRLKTFTAFKQNASTLLQWTTAMEQNAARFAIEHSTDGRQWHTLGAVPATGNSTSDRQYSYVHTTPAKGRNHYRLLLADNDGKSSYSTVNVVNFEETTKAFTVQQTTVTNGQVQVVVHTKMILSLFSQDGKMLWTRDLPAGSHVIPITNAAKGMHYLSGNGATERIMIQ